MEKTLKPLGIYIHIPFCNSRCSYCDFVSSTFGDSVKNEYVKALLKEINSAKNILQNDYYVDSVYIGGGTPTTLPEGSVYKILNEIDRQFKLQNAEISVEGNPCTFDIKKALELKEAGVNRISLGIQSMNDNLLKALGRNSSEYINRKALDILCSNFNNINTDIMLGIPYQTIKDITDTAGILFNYPLKHISAYSLILEEGTLLYDRIKKGELSAPNDDATVDLYEKVYDMLKLNNFNRYEISNFALKGYECKHNIKYWTREDYIGFGVSAHNLINETRYSNIKDIKDYIKRMNSGESVIDEKNKLNIEEQIKEYIMLGFRTEKGIDIAYLNNKYGIDFKKIYSKQLEKLNQFLIINENRIAIKPQFMNIMNSIIVEFM